jgi:hypothetical protein
MDDDEWEHSNCLTIGGIPQLLWETLQRIGYIEPLVYYTREYFEGNVSVCELRLCICQRICIAQHSRQDTVQSLEEKDMMSVRKELDKHW